MKKSIFFKNRYLLAYILAILILFGGIGYLARYFKISADQASSRYFPPGCEQTCPTIHLTCESSEGTVSTTEAGSCNIKIPAEMCSGQGINSGDYSYSQFANINQCKQFSGGDTLNNAVNCCALRGLLQKACIPSGSSPNMPKCNDVKADNLEQACHKDVMDYYCDPDNPKVDIGECQANCQDNMTVMAPAKIVNACMCEEGNDENEQGVDGDSCCACLNECKNLKRVNEQIYPKYCQIGAGITQERLDEQCNSLVESQCDNFNKDSKRYENGSLVDATCARGTMFRKEMCQVQGFAAPALNSVPKDYMDQISNQMCANMLGSSFDFKARIKVVTMHNCIPQPEGKTCWQSGLDTANCPEGSCSDGRGGWTFTCIKAGCDYSTGPIVEGDVSSGSSQVGFIKIQKASAAEPVAGVKISLQRQKGPYSIIGDNSINVLGVTDNNGKIYFNLRDGVWNVIAEKTGYQTTTQSLVVNNSIPPSLNISVFPQGQTPIVSATPSLIPSATPSLIPSAIPSVTPSLPPLISAIPSTTHDTHQFVKGYNVVGSKGSVLTQLISQNNMTAFGFDPLKNNWDRYNPGTPISMEPNQAYYVYSPSAKNLTFPAAGQSEEKILKPGWNFLWNHSVSSKTNLKYTLQDRQGVCRGKNIPLTELESKGISYRYVFIVKDPSSSEACQVFALLTGADKPSTTCSASNPVLSEVSQAPAKKGYWIYIFENKIQNLAGYSCQ